MANQTSPVIQVKDSNVGIGTSSPNVTLEANGKIRSTRTNVDSQYLQIDGGDPTGPYIIAAGVAKVLSIENRSTVNSEIWFNNAVASNYIWYQAGSEVMRITAAGNVGIGTTAPSSLLSLSKSGLVDFQLNASDQATDEKNWVWQAGASVGAGVYRLRAVNDAYTNGVNAVTFTRSGISSVTAAFSGSVTASSLIKSGGTSSQYLMADGSVSTTSNVAPRYVATVNVSQAAYTQVCTIVGGSLASAVNMSFQGTSGNVVVNVTAQILVNHFQDIVITTTSGFYSQLNIRVISNNNESYSVEAQVISTQGQTTDLNIEVFPLNSESVTFGGSPLTPGTTLVHTTRSGVYVSATEPMSVSSGSDIYAAGNVGIGTTSPSYKLDVNGDINTSSGVYRIGGSTILAGTTSVAVGSSGATGSVALRTTSGDGLVLNGSNVGIGTTSPAFKLEVNAGSNAGMWLQGSSDVRYHAFSSSSNDWVGYELRSSNVNSFAGGIFRNNGANNRVSLYNKNSEAISLMDAGNVGIGTTNPQRALNIVSNNAQIRISDSTAPTTNYWEFSSLFFNTNQDLFISNQSGTAVTINASLNVGIGTASPTQLLHITGTNAANNGITIQNTNASGNSQVRFLNASGTERAAITYINSADAVYFYLASAGNILNLLGSSVGIGTTGPQSKLDIERDNRTGSHPTSLSLYVTGTMGTGNVGGQAGNIEFRHSNASQGIGFGYQAIYQTGDNANEVLNILSKGTGALTLNAYPYSTGNVGINTVSPTEKLHVDGSVVVTYNNSYQGINSVGNKAILARVSPTTGIINYAEYATAANLNGFVMGSDDARVKGNIATDSLEFITNGSTRMTVLSSGNVGVNTTTPGTNFHVVGDVLIQTGALGVGVNPNATDGRIDASNDIVAYSSSDRRLKENITPIANALDKVKSLTGVEFDWKPEHKKAHGYEGHDTGVIAQEVQEVMPTAVRTNDTGYLAVRYEKMIGLLIEAMKEQQTQIDELKAKLDGLTK